MNKDELLTRTLDELRQRYPIGLYEFLFRHRPDLYKQLLDLEDRIDRAFLSGTVGELKAVLRDYWRLHMQAIEEFKKINQLGLNLLKAREEMLGERVRA